MPSTTTHSIDYPDGNSAITPLESHFEALATSTDEALTALKAQIRGAEPEKTIKGLVDDIAASNGRLALNLQTSTAAPSGPPASNGPEGTLHWDSANNALYICVDKTAGTWKILWNDSGWVSSGFTAGADATSVVNSYYRVIGGMVHVAFRATLKSASGSGDISNMTLGTIPSAVWPTTTTIYQVGSVTGADASANFTLSTSGVVTMFYATANNATGSIACVHFVYPYN